MISDPITVRLWPVAAHKHKWHLRVHLDKFLPVGVPDMTVEEIDNMIYAECDCGERLTKEQAEHRLDQMEGEW